MSNPSEPQERTSSSGMSFRFSGLLKKELREILRDRRTIITLVLMPLLVYPLLGLMLQKFFITQMASLGEVEYRILLLNESEGELFRDVFSHGERLLNLKEEKELSESEVNKPDEKLEEFKQKQPEIKILLADEALKNQSLKSLVRNGNVDVGVQFIPGENQNKKLDLNKLGGNLRLFTGLNPGTVVALQNM